MKKDIKKQTSNTIITQAYHSRCSSWKLSSKARIAWDFWTLLRIKQGEKRERCHRKSDFGLWQATHLSIKTPINKLAMKNRGFLIAAVFHFVHPVEKKKLKTSQVDTKLCQLHLSKWTSFKMLHKFSAWTQLSNFDQSEHKNWTYSVTNAWPW